MNEDENKLEITLNVHGYRPEELKVIVIRFITSRHGSRIIVHPHRFFLYFSLNVFLIILLGFDTTR